MAEVRGLILPDLLLELLVSGRWRHPGGDALSQVMPWFEDPLDFLSSVVQMRWKSQSLGLFADDADHPSCSAKHAAALPAVSICRGSTSNSRCWWPSTSGQAMTWPLRWTIAPIQPIRGSSAATSGPVPGSVPGA
jgi:hypothetical protein